MVDVARIPVYVAVQGRDLISIWYLIVVGGVGVVIGTLFGTRILERLSQETFAKTVGIILIGIGVLVLVQVR